MLQQTADLCLLITLWSPKRQNELYQFLTDVHLECDVKETDCAFSVFVTLKQGLIFLAAKAVLHASQI